MTVSFNDDEYEKIRERAKEAHLSVAAYCRFYLFQEPKQQQIRGYRMSQEVPESSKEPAIVRLKKALEHSPIPLDPIERAKAAAAIKFASNGGMAEIHEALCKENPLDKVPEGVVEDMKKNREERKLIVNSARKKIEKRLAEEKLMRLGKKPRENLQMIPKKA